MQAEGEHLNLCAERLVGRPQMRADAVRLFLVEREAGDEAGDASLRLMPRIVQILRRRKDPNK